MNKPDSIPASLLLSLLPGVGAGRYWDWVEHFGSAGNVLTTAAHLLPQCPAKAKHSLTQYQQEKQNSALAEQAAKILEHVKKENAVLLSIEQAQYPILLKQIHRAPPVLYAKGNVSLMHHGNSPVISLIITVC